MRLGGKVALIAVQLIAIVSGPGLPATALAPASDAAVLRGAHLSPDTPGVDVYLTAFAGHTTRLWLSSVGYGDVSPYRSMPTGLYAVSMRAHGAKASSPAALSWTINLRAGHAYTAAAVGMNSALHGIVISDQLTPARAGTGRVRVIQAASRAPRAIVSAHDRAISQSVAFGAVSPYRTVAAGRLALRATSQSSPSLATSAHVPVQSGAVESIVVLDARHGGIAIRYVIDAAGAGIVAGGGARAGASRPASPAPAPDRPDRAPLVLAIGVLAVSLLALGGAAAATARRKRTAGAR